jgi:FkbM family methyltransferase
VRKEQMSQGLIFDVGMHIGRDTEFYLKKGFKVVAIEANPKLVASGQVKFKDSIDRGDLIICDSAIADYEGEIEFYINDQHDDWGTISTEFASRNEKIGTQNVKVKVKCQPFLSILNQYDNPYYIKIDIEGADTLCLKDLYHAKSRPKYISIEAGLLSFDQVFTELSLLWNLGYRSFKIVNQALNSKIKPLNPPLEGVYADYAFDGSCSGPFGEEAPGQWLDIEQTLSRYKKILWESKYFGANGKLYRSPIHRIYNVLNEQPVGWYDFHAKLDLPSS